MFVGRNVKTLAWRVKFHSHLRSRIFATFIQPIITRASAPLDMHYYIWITMCNCRRHLNIAYARWFSGTKARDARNLDCVLDAILILTHSFLQRKQHWQHWRAVSSARITRTGSSPQPTTRRMRWRCRTSWSVASSARAAPRSLRSARSPVRWYASAIARSARVDRRIAPSLSPATRTPSPSPSISSTWGKPRHNFIIANTLLLACI